MCGQPPDDGVHAGALLYACVLHGESNTGQASLYACVTRRKQHRPGIAPNANTTHVPTAGSSAAPTKPNHTPSRHSRAKGNLLLQTVTPHAAGSRRTHVSRTLYACVITVLTDSLRLGFGCVCYTEKVCSSALPGISSPCNTEKATKAWHFQE